MNPMQEFSDEQKQYLQGFASGVDAFRTSRGLPPMGAPGGLPVLQAPAAPPAAATIVIGGPEAIHRRAQDRFLAEGKKLSNEEQAKRDKNPFEMWDEMRGNAEQGKFPKGTDVFLYKYHGLFFVAPAQNSFMCRLRFPNGVVPSYQLRGLADVCTRLAAGHVDVTTRANFQIREIPPENAVDLLTSLHDLGVVPRGSGADNLRNITGSATAGFDPQELIDTRPLCKELNHYVLNHRELYGLPRKFNIAFDGGGSIPTLEDTNDIGFVACRVGEGKSAPAGVYFRVELGGITGHRDFARDTGVMLAPKQCLPVAVAMLKVFIEHGDRTDRKKARLKYLLDAWGFEKFLAETEKLLGWKLPRFPKDDVEPRREAARLGHVGFHPQKQAEKFYVGVALPVGRMTAAQLRGVARIADVYGSGEVRLTVWQNLLIPDLSAGDLAAVEKAVQDLGLECKANGFRAGLVACTGNRGCKYAAADTKGHALKLAGHLESKLTINVPINIHLTGCHHSCAQHYIGDIGLIATKVERGEDMVEGYHVHLGGGFGSAQAVGMEFRKSVAFDDLPELIEAVLRSYLAERTAGDQPFHEFVRASGPERLTEWTDRRLADMHRSRPAPTVVVEEIPGVVVV